jgi:glycosyltransferase involved in cell wall biosynthesis
VGNILILVPGENARGGITNYYYSIRKDLPENISYFYRGSRNWPKRASRISELFRLITDYFKFIGIVMKKDVKLVQTTTAFYSNSIFRDGLFLFISRLFGKKTIVFFRGWDDNFVHNISGLKKYIVKKIFFKSDAIIDLSEHNIEYLKRLGYTGQLYLETTLVDKALVDDIDINSLVNQRIGSTKKSILFLSRIEKAKGVYELLNVYTKVKKTNPEFHLIFAGDGSEVEGLKEEVRKNNIKDVNFTGFVTGEVKKNLFVNASIFVFLSEVEGMPNAVLEAMSFGLPVITTNAGGIASVFKDGKNGRIVESVNTDFISENIVNIVNDKKVFTDYSTINYYEAKNTFWSNVVAERMMKIFNTVLDS